MAKKKKEEIIIDGSEYVQKEYSPEDFAIAVNDLSLLVNNAYFRTPFARCPDCNKGMNTIMAHFGKGAANKIGNLIGFQATIGDVIAWNSPTFKGLSVVKTKDNGVFGLETFGFTPERKEPAVIEKIIIPSKYRPLIGKMATYLANKNSPEYAEVELVKIGESEYPIAIKKEL